MARRIVPYEEILSHDLQDPVFERCPGGRIENGADIFLLALRDVAKARGMRQPIQLSRESLYRTLSRKGNPRFSTLEAVWRASLPWRSSPLPRRSTSSLDGEEVKILQDFERGELTSTTSKKRSVNWKRRPTSSFKRTRINIRISSRDLNSLQKRATKEGMPYQTLISSTLHKFVTGKLKSIE